MCENTAHAILSALGSSYDVAFQVLTLAHAVISELIYIDHRRDLPRESGLESPHSIRLLVKIFRLGISPQPNGPGKARFSDPFYPLLRVWSL